MTRFHATAQGNVAFTEEEEAEADAREAAEAARMPTLKEYEADVQSMMDATARAAGYDNLLSACSYAACPNAWQEEGQKFLEWRSAVWTKCHEVMADVQSGEIDQPTLAELRAMLPELE